MSPLELISLNLTVYRNDPDYIKAALNIGLGVFAFVIHDNINYGLKLIYRVSSEDPKCTQELDLNWLHSLNEFNFHLSDIKYLGCAYSYNHPFTKYEFFLENICNETYIITHMPINHVK